MISKSAQKKYLDPTQNTQVTCADNSREYGLTYTQYTSKITTKNQ